MKEQHEPVNPWVGGSGEGHHYQNLTPRNPGEFPDFLKRQNDAINGPLPAHQETPDVTEERQLFAARAFLEMDTPQPEKALSVLGNIPPEMTDLKSLQRAKSWWQLQAQALINLHDYEGAIVACVTGLWCDDEAQIDDPHQLLYRGVLFITLVDASVKGRVLSHASAAKMLQELGNLSDQLLNHANASSNLSDRYNKLREHIDELLVKSDTSINKLRYRTPISAVIDLPYDTD